MNLIQQFPDVSLQMRNRVKWNQKTHHARRMSIGHLEGDDLVFYDDEFKKWHYKLALIIGLGLACLYGVVLAGSQIFQWVIMNRNSNNI